MTHTSNRIFCLQAKLIIDKYKFILKGVLPKYFCVEDNFHFGRLFKEMGWMVFGYLKTFSIFGV